MPLSSLFPHFNMIKSHPVFKNLKKSTFKLKFRIITQTTRMTTKIIIINPPDTVAPTTRSTKRTTTTIDLAATMTMARKTARMRGGRRGSAVDWVPKVTWKLWSSRALWWCSRRWTRLRMRCRRYRCLMISLVCHRRMLRSLSRG